MIKARHFYIELGYIFLGENTGHFLVKSLLNILCLYIHKFNELVTMLDNKNRVYMLKLYK